MKSIEHTVRLKAVSDEQSVLAGSEFHTVKILHGKIFFRILQEFRGMHRKSEKKRKRLTCPKMTMSLLRQQSIVYD